MKIKLTETQYNRLLTEDKNYGRLGDTFQQYMVRVFKFLGKKNLSDEEIKKTIIYYCIIVNIYYYIHSKNAAASCQQHSS